MVTVGFLWAASFLSHSTSHSFPHPPPSPSLSLSLSLLLPLSLHSLSSSLSSLSPSFPPSVCLSLPLSCTPSPLPAVYIESFLFFPDLFSLSSSSCLSPHHHLPVALTVFSSMSCFLFPLCLTSLSSCIPSCLWFHLVWLTSVCSLNNRNSEWCV